MTVRRSPDFWYLQLFLELKLFGWTSVGLSHPIPEFHAAASDEDLLRGLVWNKALGCCG